MFGWQNDEEENTMPKTPCPKDVLIDEKEEKHTVGDMKDINGLQ